MNNQDNVYARFAVLETKSNASCQTPSDENSTKPRVKNLEQ